MQLDSTLKLDFHEAFATADENKWSVEIGALLSVDSDSLLVLCGNSRLYEMSRHNQEGRIGEKLACRCTMIPLAPQIVSNIEILQLKQEKSNKLLSDNGTDLQESTWLAFFQADSHLLLHHIQSDTTLSALVSFTSPLQNRSDSTDQDVDSDLTLEFSITHIYFDSVLGLMHCFSSHGWHYVFKLKFDKSMDSELKALKNDLKMRLLAKERLHEAQLGIPSSIECFAASLDQKELDISAENISNAPVIPKASHCKRYATADRSGILQIYTPISSDRKSSSGCFKTHAVIKAHGKPITSLCFSTDENASLIMTGSRDKSIKIWQSDSLVEQATLLGHKRAINHLLYLPNRTLLSASIDGVIKQWSMDDYSCQRSFTMPHTLQQSAATNITMLYPVDLHEFLACSATGHIIKFSYKKMTSKIISRLPLKNSTEDNYDKKPDITDNEAPEKIIYTIGNNVIQRCATLAYSRAKVDLPLFMASDSNIFEVTDCTDEINESLKTETIENIQK
ncbi:MAG: p21-activated protein kinase-interacting protein 1-like protein, partial [Marteilia pararefringens]